MKKTIRLTESDIRRMVMEALNELDPRTYANYSRGRAAQGDYKKAVYGQRAAIDAWNRDYEKDELTPNGFVQQDPRGYGYWTGYDRDSYRMPQGNVKNSHRKIKWDSPDYWKDEYENGNYATERLRSRNFPGPNNQDDQETFTTYDPETDKTTSTTYGDMKYQTGWFANDYAGKPIINKHNIPSGSKGDDVAKQMAKGNGTYVPGKGWMEEAVTRAIRKYLK